MICQLRKYLEKLYVNVTILFNNSPPQDPKIFLKIMEILITKGNLTLIPKEATEEHLTDLSRKNGCNHLHSYKRSSRILPIVVSIVSCSPLSSCYKLKILLPNYLTCFQVALKSLESLPNDSYYA